MSLVDFFNTDGMNLVSLTKSINILPFVPGKIGKMGLFTSEGITTRTALIEEQKGVLALLPSKPVGSPGTVARKGERTIRSIAVPHIPHDDRIEAASLVGVREFGSEDRAMSMTKTVNDRLVKMRQNHETTLEWLRMGAIHGKVIDGDGTTELVDLFALFGIGEPSEVDFLLGTDTTDILGILTGLVETIEDALGAMSYDHIHAFCGRTWFKAFVAHPNVKYAYQYYEDGAFLRSDKREGFTFGDVTFEVYRGKIGSKDFVDPVKARFFPVGVPDLFHTVFGPADFIETVGTKGVEVYAKQKIEDFERGVAIHTQSNPLPFCTRPGTLIGGKTTT